MTAFKTGRRPRPEKDKWGSILEKNLTSISRSKRDRIFASNAGLCARQTAGYRCLPGTHTEKRKAVTAFYFKIGSTYEKIVKRGFVKAGIYIDDETRVESTHSAVPVSGRIDFIIRDPDRMDDLVLVELKSCGKLPTKPRHSHLAQLQTYLLLTGMPRGLIWYISRDIAVYPGPFIKQVVFPITPTWEEREHTAQVLSEGAIFGNLGILPDKPDYMRKTHCGFCPLLPNCWGSTSGIPLVTMEASEKVRADLICQAAEVATELLAMTPHLQEEFIRVMTEH